MVEHPDPEISAAINEVPPIDIPKEKLKRPGWVSHPNAKYLIVGHKPKTFRTATPRFPRCEVRSTWLFREGSWVKVEDKVNVRELDNKVARLEGNPILSLTIFEDPDVEPDSDNEGNARSLAEADLRAEAKSVEHLFSHRPKNPFCEVCQRAKMLAPQARKKGGSSTIVSKAFGDHITVDHIITRDLRDHGFQDERVALVVKDVFTKFRYVYPSPTKSSDQCFEDLLHFLGQEDAVGVFYSDNAPELHAAIKSLGVRHVTSREYVDTNKSVIEREIRTILEGTRSNLVQAGLPDKLWPLAAQHHAMALNATKRLDNGIVPWEARYGEPFSGIMIPFGARVLYWNNPKQNIPASSKFAPTGVEGIFLGYHIQPGFVWKEEYLVTPVKGCDFAFEIGNFPILRSKRMELLPGDFTFPMRSEQLALQESLRKPTLADQDCSWGDTEGAGTRAPPGDSPDEPLPPPGVPDLDGSDLKDRLSEYLDQVAKENEDYVPEDVGAVEDWLGRDAPGSSKEATSTPKASSTLPRHDPKTMPDGKKVPKGYNWDGVRLVRDKKGSKRPPDTPSEFWHMYSKAQREADIERFERKKAREAEEDARKALRDSPAMPVIAEPDPEPHRDRMASLYWAKLDQVASEMFAVVARVVGPKEIESTPAAKEAMDREWKKLADKSCWLEKKVREYRDVAAEAKHKNVKAHFGKIFEICSVKGDELPDGHPQKKWKGRSVFQGNNVQDENHDHAIFAELGSSPASMEAGKIIDVFGSQPGYVKQQADGIAAYTQALFKGIETWVRLPRNRWPKEWSGYEDPVCPLRLALYGHPDSGGIWERYCTEQLESVGFTAVLPDIWHSVFYHAELDLLLVVYVDDFKMAGPQDKINKGWELIAKVIDMEPAEVLGRYFGCHHVEQNQVQLSREDHPFAYVFDKKHASPAADYQVRPNRKEDFWEVDAELAAVVRHHIYPRRKLYVPTQDDVSKFPHISRQRITVFDDGRDPIHDDLNQGGPADQSGWWTGRTYFPITEVSDEDFSHALAAKHNKPKRSKAEAKREARQSKFKSTESISQGKTPSMTVPVNVVYYDMRDFLVSCVDRYCELAKVDKKSLKHVATPFHENRVAKVLENNEPSGKLQPIASRVLMKVLFAARMARWDLLRATQALASRVTKWSRDCDVALHRLISYINSSLEVRMRGFIGDRIQDCKLWMFCDADHAGSHDSKSTSGCALYLVGPNTYFPLNAFSKKQTSITTSSTESEVVAANQGIRAQGLPSLSLWIFLWREVASRTASYQARPKTKPNQRENDIIARIDPELDEIRYGECRADGRSVSDLNGLKVHLSPKFAVQLLEDNQATITILLKGDSEKLRHTDRTQRISFAWIKQQFERNFFEMINVDTKEQVADIFTKPFADRGKWEHALRLIAHVDAPLQGGRQSKAHESDAHLINKPVVHAHPVVKPSGDPCAVAAELTKDRDFSTKALLRVAQIMYPNKTKRKMIKLDNRSYYHIFGQWSYGGMQGVTKATRRWPQIARFLNGVVQAHAPKDFTWNSVLLNSCTSASVHKDHGNAKDSMSFALSVGDFKDGELWFADPLVPSEDAIVRVGPNGKRLKGRAVSTLNKAIIFDPRKLHCVLPFTGTRFSIVAYTSRSQDALQDQELNSLKTLGFRLPPRAASGASAREYSRPLGFKRIIVEFCCSPNSKLGQDRSASQGCYVLRVTSEDDVLKDSTLTSVVQKISTLCDEGGASKPILVYASLPCTGGCPWNRMTPDSPKWEQHQELFCKLLKQFRKFIRKLKEYKPQVAFELPKDCDYWKWDHVQHMVNDLGLEFYRCDGCMLGITNHQGLPLRKAWTIASSIPLQRLAAHKCDRSHVHGESRGQNLKDSENYSHAMTDCIHIDWKSFCDRRSNYAACAQQQFSCDHKHVCTRKAEQTNALAACCILAAEFCAPDMEATNAGIVAPTEVLRQWWDRRLWETSLSSEYRTMAPFQEDEASVNNFYKYLPRPLACEYALSDVREAGLVAKIGKLTDQGLAMLQPESTRGRLRYLVIVADSTTTFLTEGNWKTDLLADIKANRGNAFPHHLGVEYIPTWGANLTRLVELAVGKVTQLERETGASGQVSIDLMMIWNGNEFVGERGLFLDPGFKSKTEWLRGYPHMAKGSWEFIGPKVLREIGKLADLQSRASVGTVLLTSATDAASYCLPRDWGTIMADLLDYAAQLGLAVKHFNTPASQIRKFDHFHFQEDSAYRLQLLRWLGFTARIMVLRHQCSFFKEADIDLILQNYGHVSKPNVKFAVDVQVEEKLLNHFRKGRVAPTYQPLVEADPWDDIYFQGPQEQFPDTAPNHFVHRDFKDHVHLGDGEYVTREDYDEMIKKSEENAPRPGEAVVVPSSSSTARETKEKLLARGEVYSRQRTDPESSAPKRAKKGPHEADYDEPIKSGYYTTDDDWCLVDMLGLDWDAIHLCPPEGEAEWVDILQDEMPNFKYVNIPQHHKTALSGIVRGKIVPGLQGDGLWCSTRRILEAWNKKTNKDYGLGMLLTVVKNDNRSRFQLRIDRNHPLAEYYGLGGYPTLIRANQGISKDAMKGVPDSILAEAWFSMIPEAEMDVHSATWEGRPVLPLEKIPRRLYHRTYKDRAFAILDSCFIPGHHTANAFVYFADREVGPGENAPGVRSDRPVEIVINTMEALSQGAGLFYSRSDGVLCREAISGSTVLYIRDTRTDEILWSATDGPEGREEEENAPQVEEAESSGSMVVEAVGPLQEAQEEPDVEHEEAPLVKEEFDVPILEEVESTVPELPHLRVRFNTDADVIEVSPSGRNRLTEGQLQVVPDEGMATRSTAPATQAPRPGWNRGITQVQCVSCGKLRLEGQHKCFHCGYYVTRGATQSAFRMWMARERSHVLDALAEQFGKGLWELDAAKIRQAAGTHDLRGQQSVDGRAIMLARQNLKGFMKHGYTSMVDKFDQDDTYAIHAIKGGWTRRRLTIQDCVACAYLPNQGRSREQRELGYGSNKAWENKKVNHEGLARMVFFDKNADDLVLAGLIDDPNLEPMGYAWLGNFMGVKEFARTIRVTRAVSHILTFTEGIIGIPDFDEEEHLAVFLAEILSENYGGAKETCRRMKESAEASRAAQARADARRTSQNAPRFGEADRDTNRGWSWSDNSWSQGDWHSSSSWRDRQWQDQGSWWSSGSRTTEHSRGPWRYDHRDRSW